LIICAKKGNGINRKKTVIDGRSEPKRADQEGGKEEKAWGRLIHQFQSGGRRKVTLPAVSYYPEKIRKIIPIRIEMKDIERISYTQWERRLKN